MGGWTIIATGVSAIGLAVVTTVSGVWWVITALMLIRVLPLGARHAATLS